MSIDKSTKDSRGGIARSAGVIAMATLASRILGFIRDIVIARLFGVFLFAQAFVIAFKIPNLFRDLVGEGATNAAFVPVFSEYLAKTASNAVLHPIQGEGHFYHLVHAHELLKNIF